MNRYWLIVWVVWQGLPVSRSGAQEAPGSVLAPFAAAPFPNDAYFGQQWYLENPNRVDGDTNSVDLNIRAAWAITRGEGTTVAIVDDGVELAHPELAPRADADLHFNFETKLKDGHPTLDSWSHGTAVAGLALAEGYNNRGMAGAAPAAQLASWVIFTTNNSARPFVPPEAMAEMFQHRSNQISVQNHSWSFPGVALVGPSAVERAAMSNAVRFGRDGKGVAMVWAAGNGRLNGRNANEDGYASNPDAIAVAAVLHNGRAAEYSNPGACVLVAGPSADSTSTNLFTTDRLGTKGYNFVTFPNSDLSDYGFGSLGFNGTSASAPLVSGVVALILSANPNLTSRDARQILIHSGRHYAKFDPDLATNGAGFAVSHNDGFGVPDAGFAVRLARAWSNRPPAVQISSKSEVAVPIPDDGLRVVVTGNDLPAALASMPALPTVGIQPDAPTASLPTAFLGKALSVPAADLHGQAALIQRGDAPFAVKIGNAAAAGAAFVILYNNVDDPNPQVPGGTDYAPLPAVFLSKANGEALQLYLAQHPEARVKVAASSAETTFNIAETLQCEQVAVRLKTSHTRRGDLRIALVSPAGTTSVLQKLNADLKPGPVDWTYYSVHHYYESSAGVWTLRVTDEAKGEQGSVLFAELQITGVPITDTDHDGLDDDWEMRHFGTLARGQSEDTDGDGYSNAREQILGTDPNGSAPTLAMRVQEWFPGFARMNWASVAGRTYELQGSADLKHWAPLGVIAGRFPVTEAFLPTGQPNSRFFQVVEKP